VAFQSGLLDSEDSSARAFRLVYESTLSTLNYKSEKPNKWTLEATELYILRISIKPHSMLSFTIVMYSSIQATCFDRSPFVIVVFANAS
jgi:hypothetical protein